MRRALVAFSGGVDSTFLLKAAVEALGDDAVAFLAISPSLPPWELDDARRFALEMGARIVEVQSRELDRPDFRRNADDRCFHCKTELFELARAHAARLDIETICYGAIPDDLGDHRPGMQAADAFAVRAPLVEVGLSKAEIRALSKEMGLATWDKPATACLSSRFPYGTSISASALEKVAGCEGRLRQLGFTQLRARNHGDLVRLELVPQDLEGLFASADLRERVMVACKAAGFHFVSVDLQGYRTGSANEVLDSTARSVLSGQT